MSDLSKSDRQKLLRVINNATWRNKNRDQYNESRRKRYAKSKGDSYISMVDRKLIATKKVEAYLKTKKEEEAMSRAYSNYKYYSTHVEIEILKPGKFSTKEKLVFQFFMLKYYKLGIELNDGTYINEEIITCLSFWWYLLVIQDTTDIPICTTSKYEWFLNYDLITRG